MKASEPAGNGHSGAANAAICPSTNERELASRRLNPEMISGHEAVDLEKREPSVAIARFSDSGCSDDLDITWAARRLA